jgi:hypothetical protein
VNKVTITMEINECSRCPHSVSDWITDSACGLMDFKIIPWAPNGEVNFPIPDWCPLLSVKSETM